MFVLISYREECLEEGIPSEVEFFSFASEDELCQCLANRLFEAESNFKNIILRNWQDAINLADAEIRPQMSTNSITVPWNYDAQSVEDRANSIGDAHNFQRRIKSDVYGILQIKKAEKEVQDRVRQERITEGTLRLEVEKAKLRLNDFLAKKKEDRR